MGIRFFTANDIFYMLQTVRWTLFLSALAFIGGGLIGVLITLARISKSRFFRGFAIGYVEVLQGTPLLMQLFLWFFLLTLFFPVKLPATLVAAIALTLNASSFATEIWRGSIEAIARTQWEAAASIGMSRLEQLRHIIAPQAVQIALAPTVGLLVIVIKGDVAHLADRIRRSDAGGAACRRSDVRAAENLQRRGAIYLALCLPLSDTQPGGSNGDSMSIVSLTLGHVSGSGRLRC